MLADVDRMVVGENAGLECKTASPYVAYQWEDGKIPFGIKSNRYKKVKRREARDIQGISERV